MARLNRSFRTRAAELHDIGRGPAFSDSQIERMMPAIPIAVRRLLRLVLLGLVASAPSDLGADDIVIGFWNGVGRFEVFGSPASGLPHAAYRQVPWSNYSDRCGDTLSLSFGNLDADLGQELVVGLGVFPQAGGWFAVFDDESTNHVLLAWLRVNWVPYNARNGETRPACGDFDGDGRDEIAVGLGWYPEAGGWVAFFDDASTGFARLPWVRVLWPAYNAANGETWPAAGNVDDDARDELVLGFGRYPDSGGWVRILDDAAAGHAGLSWLRLDYSAYNAAVGVTYPALGDLDADGRDELVVGMDGFVPNGGYVRIFDDQASGFARLRWGRLPFSGYNAQNGTVRPSVGQLDWDGEGRADVVMGTGYHPPAGGWFYLWMNPLGPAPSGQWGRVEWSAYNSVNGTAWPAAGVRATPPVPPPPPPPPPESSS